MTHCTYGILGGTFDPPHKSHLEMAQRVKTNGLVDKVLFVPCFLHAFNKKPVSFEHRIEMCKKMAAACDFVEVSDIERHIEHPGRTFYLIRALCEKHPNVQFRLVVGADIYLERKKWFRFDWIEQQAPPIYFAREGIAVPTQQWLKAPPKVSSSEIRSRLMKGQQVDDLVSDAVLKYILEHHLYESTK